MRTTTLCSVLLVSIASACAASHADCDSPDAAPPDGRAACPAPLVDEGDACVGWRAIPPPPCTPMAFVQRVEEGLGVRCVEGYDVTLHAPSDTWEHASGDATVLAPAHADLAPLPIVAVLPDGTQIATHGDPYALPAAERTDARGAWHETLPPPSAFLAIGTALSDHEALFVGRDAFVYTIVRR